MLAGGGARGAYQVGVIRFLREALPEPARSHAHFDILAGCSVGAVNASFLAATAHRPEDQGRLLQSCWNRLHANDLYRMGWRRWLRLPAWLLGGAMLPGGAPPHAGLLNAGPLVGIVRDSFPWPNIDRNIQSGALDALALSATDISSGRTFVFAQTRSGKIPAWASDPRRAGIPTRIGPEHALASAAIPLLFPPVEIDGRLFCDGGLRQIAPLSPALRLGAERALVVSLRYVPPPEESGVYQQSSLRSFPGAIFLLSKVLNSLLLDQLDHDLHQLEVINTILDVGEESYGPEFRYRLDQAVACARGVPYRKAQTLVLRPSKDPGVLAARHAQQVRLSSPWRQLLKLGLTIAAPENERAEGDLLSYLLFDAPYVNELIELGYADAAARAQELVDFFSPARPERRYPSVIDTPQVAS